jgi:hypothetical protein
LYDQYFGRLEGESDDDSSDALVCKGLDKPNYISADHGYYPVINVIQIVQMMKIASMILADLLIFRNCTLHVIEKRMVNSAMICWMI